MAVFGPPPLITRDDLIDVLDRNFEPHWFEGLAADPSSLSLFEGTVAVLLRIQDAIDENFSIGSYILTAPGRAKATSTVRLQRPSGAEVTLTVEVRFLDDRGAVWVPQADFVIPASGGSQTVDVPIETERSGYFLNSFEPLTYQAVDTLPDPNLIVILGVDPASGGKTPFLDQHGKERRVHRAPGETDAQYQNRIRFLEDQVSPKALSDTVVEVLDEFPATKFIVDLIDRDGLRAVREPFLDTAQIAQRGLIGTVTAFADDPGLFADDVSGHILRDIEDVCSWFDVLLPTPVDPNEARQFYDDGSAASGAFLDDPLLGYFDLPTGDAILTPIAALADELDRRRSACVRFRIIQGGDISVLRHPKLTTLSVAGDWVDQDGSATDANLVAALEDHDADFRYVVSSTGTGPGSPIAAGDLHFTLATLTQAPISIDRVILRARVRQRDVAAGTDPDFQFIIKPTTAGAPERVGVTATIISETYQEQLLILEENPIAAAAWTLADIAGAFAVGVANVAAVGATEELRVSELALEFVISYG